MRNCAITVFAAVIASWHFGVVPVQDPIQRRKRVVGVALSVNFVFRPTLVAHAFGPELLTQVNSGDPATVPAMVPFFVS